MNSVLRRYLYESVLPERKPCGALTRRPVQPQRSAVLGVGTVVPVGTKTSRGRTRGKRQHA